MAPFSFAVSQEWPTGNTNRRSEGMKAERQDFHPPGTLPIGLSGVNPITYRRLQLPSEKYPCTATLSGFQKFCPLLVPLGLGSKRPPQWLTPRHCTAHDNFALILHTPWQIIPSVKAPQTIWSVPSWHAKTPIQ